MEKTYSQSVSPEQFKEALFYVCQINRVYDYYGMVEQTEVYIWSVNLDTYMPQIIQILLQGVQNILV